MSPPRRQAISGLKYSQGLCLLRLGQSLDDRAAGLCRELADQEINLVFAGGGSEDGGPGELCLCLREEYLAQAWQAARAQGGGGELASPEIISPVALLTIYPLGPGLSLCGRVLASLAGAGLTHLALGTSLSALVVALPQDDLPQALEALQGLLELPAGVGPTHQPVTTMTVAKRPPA
ncbi:MAG: hypothetical protein V1806_06295 [Pseudomonadota bacterium]